MSDFAHLHLHSEFSLLDGANRMDELCEHVKGIGQESVAITDHGTIAGSIPLITAAKKAEIKPIIGCEAYIVPGSMEDHTGGSGSNYHLTMLIQNKVGWMNMVQMTSQASLRGFHHRPRMDKRLLKKHNEGIILLTGCIGAELPQLLVHGKEDEAEALLGWYRHWFRDRVFVELMYHGSHRGIDHTRIEEDGVVLMEEGDLNDALIELAERCDVPIVATNDAHYLHEKDGEHHDTLICKGKGKFDPKRKFRFPGAKERSHEFHVKSGTQMRAAGSERWDDIWVEACKRTVEVAAMIDREVMPNEPIYPKFQVPEDDKEFNTWLEAKKY